jgi:hypothetical protein
LDLRVRLVLRARLALPVLLDLQVRLAQLARPVPLVLRVLRVHLELMALLARRDPSVLLARRA